MPRILIDLYKINNPYSGLGRFSLQFAEALLQEAPPGFEFIFLVPRRVNLPKSLKGQNLLYDGLATRYIPQSNPRFDLWHSLHQFPSHPPRPKTPRVLTIHDLNFLVEKSGAKRKNYLQRLQKLVDRSVALTCISVSARTDVKQYLNLGSQPLQVIHNGVATPVAPSPTAPSYHQAAPFFFSIGIFQAKKQFHLLLPLLEDFPKHHLVIAGNHATDYGKLVKSEIQRLGLAHRVQLPGKISEAEKSWLYAHCEAFLFPSQAEGFGMPVVEAMQHGKPVFLNQIEALKEVGGDQAWYVDVSDEDDFKQMVKQGLQEFRDDSPLLEEVIKEQAAKFNWSKSIHKYLHLYTQLIG